MKAVAFFLLLSALLLSGANAFALIRSLTHNTQQPLYQWVGKPADQLIKTFGKPNFISATKDGRLVYDFVREPQHVGPIPTYQFTISQDKTVAAAKLIL